MQVHIALYQWKPDATEDQINEALAEITSLEQKVPGVVEISCARNESKFSEGYSHVILVRGESADALAAYRNHPDHDTAAAKIETMELHGIGVDFATKRTD